MAGIAIILDVLKRKQSLSTQSLQSYGLFSATVAATTAAASIAAGRPFASRSLFGGGIPIAYCDAGAALDEGYIPNLRSASENILQHESLNCRTKEYPVEIKPLFSAFGLKSLAITSVRSFLLFYLPLWEPRPPLDDDDDFLQESPEEKPVDLVVPFKNSIKQIFRETAVVTTRRLLERLAVQHVSQRMAWKLLKDVPKSAKRKAARGMPTTLFVYSVSRTTFRGHLLGVAASWVIQIIIETYRCLIRKPVNKDESDADRAEKIRLLGKKVYATTVKCGASLVFASMGAGIGALFHPYTGQWIVVAKSEYKVCYQDTSSDQNGWTLKKWVAILLMSIYMIFLSSCFIYAHISQQGFGCALGDFAGPIIAIICLEKLHLEL